MPLPDVASIRRSSSHVVHAQAPTRTCATLMPPSPPPPLVSALCFPLPPSALQFFPSPTLGGGPSPARFSRCRWVDRQLTRRSLCVFFCGVNCKHVRSIAPHRMQTHRVDIGSPASVRRMGQRVCCPPRMKPMPCCFGDGGRPKFVGAHCITRTHKHSGPRSCGALLRAILGVRSSAASSTSCCGSV